jgi:hypothetical protein
MESVLEGHPRAAQGIAQFSLQGDQARQVGTGDAGPEHPWTADSRESAHALRGQVKASML